MAKIGTMQIDNAVCGTINVMLEDIGAFSVSSSALYSNSITAELATMERRFKIHLRDQFLNHTCYRRYYRRYYCKSLIKKFQ